MNITCEPFSLYPLVLRDYLDKIEAFLPQIAVPTLVVRGSRDTVVPQRWAEQVTHLLPQGALVVLDKAAHDVNYNLPAELARTIRAFLEEHRMHPSSA